MRRFTILLCVIAMLAFSVAVFAQSDTARVVGTITDTSGAAIPGVSVTATNTATGRAITVQTDGTGSYVIGSLPPGTYNIDAKVAKFKTASAKNVVLQISQVQEISLKMVPGGAEEVVNVTDEVPLVETTTSSTGEVIQGRQVTELPLNGRNFTQLALLTPGVTRGAYGDISMGGSGGTSAETFRNSETGGAALSANGLRPQANNFILDGVDNNESLVNSIVFFPPAEAIQEFRVNTSVAPAEYGRAGGAIVQTSIKSGSNAFHGSVFEFRRSGFMDAHQWNTPGPIDFKQNQFGATLGGPLWKNRLFFFADYQGRRQNQPQNDGLTTVPTDAMRNGDFSALLGHAGITYAPNAAICPNLYSGGALLPQFDNSHGYIFDPMTCLPFGWNGTTATNIIPSNRMNPVAVRYLNLFPEPNAPGNVGFPWQNNYQPYRQSIRNFDDFDARLDYVIGQNDTLFTRYSYGQDNFTVTDRLRDATHDLPSGWGSGANFNHPRGFASGWTHTFSSSVISEFRFAWTRPAYGYNPPLQSEALAASIGIPNANRNSLLGGMALIGGWGNYGELEYTGDGGPYQVPQRTLQFSDSISWTHMRHTFKFGFNILNRKVDFVQGNNAKGYFWIDGGDPSWGSGLVGCRSGAFTGYQVSELLAGFVCAYNIGTFNGYYDTRNWETGYFAQDDWRVTDKLTLNLGLRYDLYTWPYEQNDMQSNFDPTTGTLVHPNAPGWPRSLINTDTNNLAPRVGFAYDLRGNGKTVIRGGYGMFYFLDRGGVGLQLSNNPDFNGTSQYNACVNVGGTIDCSGATPGSGYRIALSGAAPIGSMNSMLATGPLPSATAAANPNNLTSANNVIYYPRNSQNSSIQQWNIQIEQQLTSNMSVDVAYVGTKMDHLATNYNANAGNYNGRWFPNVGSINTYAFNGSGNYKGLQASLNRRMTNGLQFTAAYTWSKTRDNSNSAFAGTGGRILVTNQGVPLLANNWGNSDNDIPQFFTGSALYELPWGKGRRWMSDAPRAVDMILGGWQLNNIVTLSSGSPFDVYGGGTTSPRPNYNGGCTLNAPNHTYLNCPGGAFTLPTGNAIGTLERNYFHGPGLHTWDASIFKNIQITERVQAQLRFEGFNLTNTAQFTNPNGSLGGFDINGQSLPWNTTLNGTRFASERQFQIAARITF
jgi:outer membrane receptor protein involved in Fe transport